MRAHKRVGEIPDPHTAPAQAHDNLRKHTEIMENTSRFLSLTKEKDAKSTITSEANLKILLKMLPRRARDDPDLSHAKLTPALRESQYDKIKEWIKISKETLLLQDTDTEENMRGTITLIANHNNRQNNRVTGRNDKQLNYTGRSNPTPQSKYRERPNNIKRGKDNDNKYYCEAKPGNVPASCAFFIVFDYASFSTIFDTIEFSKKHTILRSMTTFQPDMCWAWM